MSGTRLFSLSIRNSKGRGSFRHGLERVTQGGDSVVRGGGHAVVVMEKQAKKFMKSAKSNWSKAKRSYTCRSLRYVWRAQRCG